MWLCESCYSSDQHQAFSTRSRELVCCKCKRRKRCFLVVRREAQ